MSVTPRIANLWWDERNNRMGYMDRGDEESVGLMQDELGLGDDGSNKLDHRTPLDRTIDRIGMGE